MSRVCAVQTAFEILRLSCVMKRKLWKKRVSDVKRVVGIVAVLAAIVTLCSGCSRFVCASCKQEKSGKQYVVEAADMEFSLCRECYREYGEKKAEMSAPVNNGMGDLTDLF